MLEAKSIRRCASFAYLFFVVSWLTIVPASLGAQSLEQVQRVIFYNCENLFDPADDPDKNDDEYTPEGERHWTGFRQYQKMLNIANVIMAAGQGRAPSLIGLAEVENDSVLWRLTHNTALREWEYSYLITQSLDRRGINVALLYQPSDFRLLGWKGVRIPLSEGARPTRDLLHAWGRIVGGDTLDVVVCHLPSRLGGARHSVPNRRAAHLAIRALCDSLEVSRQHPHLLVMGDMNDMPDTKQLRRNMQFGHTLHNLMMPMQRDLKSGRRSIGTHKYQGVWGFLDQFWVNGALLDKLSAKKDPDTNSGSCVWVDNVDVVHYPFMLTEDETHMGHRPLRSYHGYRYEGGYSDHLPIRLDLIIQY